MDKRKIFEDNLSMLSSYEIHLLKYLALHGPLSRSELQKQDDIPFFDFVSLIAIIETAGHTKDGTVLWKVRDKYLAELLLRR